MNHTHIIYILGIALSLCIPHRLYSMWSLVVPREYVPPALYLVQYENQLSAMIENK